MNLNDAIIKRINEMVKSVKRECEPQDSVRVYAERSDWAQARIDDIWYTCRFDGLDSDNESLQTLVYYLVDISQMKNIYEDRYDVEPLG